MPSISKLEQIMREERVQLAEHADKLEAEKRELDAVIKQIDARVNLIDELLERAEAERREARSANGNGNGKDEPGGEPNGC